MLNITRTQCEKKIKFSKSVQEAWTATVKMPDGFYVSFSMFGASNKVRPVLRERLMDRVDELYGFKK